MVEIVKITPSTIEFKGVSFKEGEKIQTILNICHRYKHMYLEGYPCGRKTRKKNQERRKRWEDCPEICFTYLLTNDNESHNLAIHILVSDMESLIERYAQEEINLYSQMYLQDISDEIIRTI